MIEVAIENDKPVRIGVNWGSLDQALLTRLMDENSKLDDPKDARDVTMEAMVQSALALSRTGRQLRHAARADHPERQSQRRAGPDRRLSRTGAPLRLCPASRTDRGRHGRERHRQQHRCAGRRAAGRHRRYHSRLAHARAQWRSHRRGHGRAADSAIHGHSQLHAAGHRLPRLRPHHQHLLPGDGRADPELPARADAGLEDALLPASKR